MSTSPPRWAVSAARRSLLPMNRVVYPFYRGVQSLRTRHPETLDEKIIYKMLRDRRRFLVQTADKVAVKRYVAERIGEQALPRTYQVVDDARDIDWGELPDEFVAKVSHGCGGTIIVSEQGAALDAVTNGSGRLPLVWDVVIMARDAPPSLLRPAMTDYLNGMAGKRYGWGNPFPFYYEWVYREIPPRVLVEEFLSDDGQSPIDYRFFVMNGEVRWIQRDYKRADGHFSSVHLPDWTQLPVSYNYDPPPSPPPVPEHLEEMLDYASRLGDGTDFVRIDLYDFDGRVVFGEMTHYPRAGRNVFDPPEFAKRLASEWQVPQSYDMLGDI